MELPAWKSEHATLRRVGDQLGLLVTTKMKRGSVIRVSAIRMRLRTCLGLRLPRRAIWAAE